MSTSTWPPVALLTYTTRPRGGVVHTLALAEALHRADWPVHVYTLGDPAVGLYRNVDVPVTVFPSPKRAPTLEERVFDAIEALTEGLQAALPDDVAILHAQDCISARVAARMRDSTGRGRVVRTVHHVDDFTTLALVDCQERSIREPDDILVVSEFWRTRLLEDFHVHSTVVGNGVDAARFAQPPPGYADLRRVVGAEDRFLYLAVGGLEPRKGGLPLVEALGHVQSRMSPAPTLAVVGGHSFQDHKPYRDRCLARAKHLAVGDALAMVGTVSDVELPGWYHAADALVFPSMNEGWGLVVLEAMAAGLPVIVSDLPVFREYLGDGDALVVPRGDGKALGEAMLRLASDEQLRKELSVRGPLVAARHTWDSCARRHMDFYSELGG